MKRFFTHLLLAVLPILLVSCVEKFGVVKEISVTASTEGFVSDEEVSSSIWNKGEQIYLFSEMSTTPIRFNLTSGVGSSTAKFKGTILTNPTYMGFRPASALKAVMSNTISFSTDNAAISFDIEDVASNSPQIGEGSSQDMAFKPIFGAVELPLSLNESCQTELVKVSVPTSGRALAGNFSYDMTYSRILSSSKGRYVASLLLDTPVVIGSTPTSLFVAMPEGAYSGVMVSITDKTTSKTWQLATTQQIIVRHGELTKVNAGDIAVSEGCCAIGEWHLTMFCGVAAEVDLYLSIKEDNTFTLYQRSGSFDYSVFTGTWEYDSLTNTLSGEYSDGTPWASSYKASITENGELRLENSANANEVAIYSEATMPTVSTSSRASFDVKPFL